LILIPPPPPLHTPLSVTKNQFDQETEYLSQSLNKSNELENELKETKVSLHNVTMDRIRLTEEVVNKEEETNLITRQLEEQKQRHRNENTKWRESREMWDNEKEMYMNQLVTHNKKKNDLIIQIDNHQNEIQLLKNKLQQSNDINSSMKDEIDHLRKELNVMRSSATNDSSIISNLQKELNECVTSKKEMKTALDENKLNTSIIIQQFNDLQTKYDTIITTTNDKVNYLGK
jgi:chromosome segregation ATPase